MSLSIEQKLESYIFTDSQPIIYTTGAYLVPMKIKYKDKTKYVWVVEEFYDDTFDKNGKICTPNLLVTRKQSIIKNNI